MLAAVLVISAPVYDNVCPLEILISSLDNCFTGGRRLKLNLRFTVRHFDHGTSGRRSPIDEQLSMSVRSEIDSLVVLQATLAVLIYGRSRDEHISIRQPLLRKLDMVRRVILLERILKGDGVFS